MRLKPEDITMRLPGSIQGLRDMVEFIGAKIDLSKSNIIEIGAFAGDSTKVFCETFHKVETIDPWVSNIGDITDKVDMEEVYKKFLKDMSPYDNLDIHRGFSFDVIKEFKRKKFNVVYIDGSHEYDDTIRDIKQWTPKVKKGGFICGHDFRAKFSGVINAVKEHFGKMPDKLFKDSSWLFRVE